MFVYHRNGHHLIVLLYVDDIILTFCSFIIYKKMKKNFILLFSWYSCYSYSSGSSSFSKQICSWSFVQSPHAL